jgi:hypothetical protein
MTGWRARRTRAGYDVLSSLFYLYFSRRGSMPIRDFTDAGGVRWQVWATTPMRGDVRPQFASGWLAFECEAERRRLTPIPAEWAEVADAELCVLLAQATAVTRGADAALKSLNKPGGGDAAVPPAPPPLVETVAKVRALLREVDETLQGDGVAG